MFHWGLINTVCNVPQLGQAVSAEDSKTSSNVKVRRMRQMKKNAGSSVGSAPCKPQCVNATSLFFQSQLTCHSAGRRFQCMNVLQKAQPFPGCWESISSIFSLSIVPKIIRAEDFRRGEERPSRVRTLLGDVIGQQSSCNL